LVADAAFGRALGFWSGDVNLGNLNDTLRNNAEFAATYVRRIHTFAIWAKDGTTVLTPVQRADVVIALAGLLDEQQFQVAEHIARARTVQAAQALIGVDFGQSVWLHDRYVARFSTAERSAYDTAINKRGTSFEAKVRNVPAAVRAMRTSPQRLGPAFVTALHAEQPDRVAASFTTDPPTALDQLQMPASKYIHRDATEPVAAPPVPNDARLVGRRQLGPFGVYLLAAEGIPATEALTASDGWGDDAVTVFRLGGKVCANGRIVADTSADADRIDRALNAWGHARPASAGALVGRKGNTLLFSACDPGIAAPASSIDTATVAQFFGRSDLLTQQIIDHGQPNRSECIAVSAFARFTARDLLGANPSVDRTSILDTVTVDCDSSV
jgi:hypothetical protein